MGYLTPKATALQRTPDKPNAKLPALLNVPEACSMLRISKWSLYRLIQSRQLKTVKIGGRRLVPLQAVQGLIEQLQAEAQA